MKQALQEHRDLVLAGLKLLPHTYEASDRHYTQFLEAWDLCKKHGLHLEDAEDSARAFLTRNPNYGKSHDWYQAEIDWESANTIEESL